MNRNATLRRLYYLPWRYFGMALCAVVLAYVLVLTMGCASTGTYHSPERLHGAAAQWSAGNALGQAREAGWLPVRNSTGRRVWLPPGATARLVAARPAEGAELLEIVDYAQTERALADIEGYEESAVIAEFAGRRHTIARAIDWSAAAAGGYLLLKEVNSGGGGGSSQSDTITVSIEGDANNVQVQTAAGEQHAGSSRDTTTTTTETTTTTTSSY